MRYQPTVQADCTFDIRLQFRFGLKVFDRSSSSCDFFFADLYFSIWIFKQILKVRSLKRWSRFVTIYDTIFSETSKAPKKHQSKHRRQMAFHHFNGFNEKMSSSEYGIPGEKISREKTEDLGPFHFSPHVLIFFWGWPWWILLIFSFSTIAPWGAAKVYWSTWIVNRWQI